MHFGTDTQISARVVFSHMSVMIRGNPHGMFLGDTPMSGGVFLNMGTAG